jgi:hypothetical protein
VLVVALTTGVVVLHNDAHDAGRPTRRPWTVVRVQVVRDHLGRNWRKSIRAIAAT